MALPDNMRFPRNIVPAGTWRRSGEGDFMDALEKSNDPGVCELIVSCNPWFRRQDICSESRAQLQTKAYTSSPSLLAVSQSSEHSAVHASSEGDQAERDAH